MNKRRRYKAKRKRAQAREEAAFYAPAKHMLRAVVSKPEVGIEVGPRLDKALAAADEFARKFKREVG